MLDTLLTNAYFVRVYTFERRYLHRCPLHRYPKCNVRQICGNAGNVVESKDHARPLFQSISEQDPDGHLGWEIEYPSSPDQFVPFLGTQIRIDNRGSLECRKRTEETDNSELQVPPPNETKVEVARNFYKTVSISSSSPELVRNLIR